ncbi:MAG TPA: nitroreductase [Polyangia bacterium]
MERASAGDPWAISPLDYPRYGSEGEQLAFAARYAALAPSSHNTQPWHFYVRREWIELVADRARALPVSDPDDRELVMACGAALFHLRVAIEHFGRAARVHLFPDPDDRDLLASIGLGPARTPSPDEVRLFDAIPARHTNRGAFARVPLPEVAVERLREIADAHHTHLIPVDGAAKAELARLVAAADRIQMRNPAFREELAAWLRANRDDNVDGMPGFAHGLGDTRSRFAPLLVRNFDQGDGRAARDSELCEGAPLLAVLATDADTPRAWLEAGEALAHVLLAACADGIAASFLNQPIEVARLRPEVAALVGGERVPQLVLRLGYGREVAATPRRPLWSMLHRFD